MSSNNNIFKITSEEHIDEILNKHPYKLIVVMFSSDTCPPCKHIKPTFIKMANNTPNSFFIYVNIKKYQDITEKYTKDVKCTQYFKMYYNNQFAGCIRGGDKNEFTSFVNKLLNKLSIYEKQRSIQQNINSCQTPISNIKQLTQQITQHNKHNHKHNH